jgi:hypothetical protein
MRESIVIYPPVILYTAERIIGNGSFGVVFGAKVVQTNCSHLGLHTIPVTKPIEGIF